MWTGPRLGLQMGSHFHDWIDYYGVLPLIMSITPDYIWEEPKREIEPLFFPKWLRQGLYLATESAHTQQKLTQVTTPAPYRELGPGISHSYNENNSWFHLIGKDPKELHYNCSISCLLIAFTYLATRNFSVYSAIIMSMIIVTCVYTM